MKDRKTSLIVVGNKFINLTCHKNIFTFDQMENLLKGMIRSPELRAAYFVLIGQGLSYEKVVRLKKLVEYNPILSKLISLRENLSTERSNEIFTHKHAKENILISDPFIIEKNKYAAYLMINDECAEMMDHVTGQHLQGMVLIEAARQLTLAVTEKYFIKDSNRKDVGFVTNKVEVNFKKYAFPIETFIEYTIDQSRGYFVNFSYHVTIHFIQNNQVVTEVKYVFSTFKKEFIYEKENMAALNALRDLIDKNEIEYNVDAA